MIRVSVLYTNSEGCRFDMDYYRDHHIPLLRARLGEVLKQVTVEQGIGGGRPGASAPYLVMCHQLFESVEAFQNAIAPHGAEIMADVANFTDIKPKIQFSRIIL
ncbi:EthD family reductase [Zobellella aerophila]|uniref:EthD family reductase n=1 Tax=Zobellella aerophila TaxID=870480 RepID=A0ABP6VPP8_9GAMM